MLWYFFSRVSNYYIINRQFYTFSTESLDFVQKNKKKTKCHIVNMASAFIYSNTTLYSTEIVSICTITRNRFQLDKYFGNLFRICKQSPTSSFNFPCWLFYSFIHVFFLTTCTVAIVYMRVCLHCMIGHFIWMIF